MKHLFLKNLSYEFVIFKIITYLNNFVSKISVSYARQLPLKKKKTSMNLYKLQVVRLYLYIH